MAVRVTVTLTEALLARLDVIASEEGLTRSEVVREASTEYVATHVASREARAREAAVAEGVDWLEEVAARTAADGRRSTDLLRELRGGEHGFGAPIDPDQGRVEHS